MTDKVNGTAVDLAALDLAPAADNGFELELLHPSNGDPLGIFITVAGTDSKRYRDAEMRMRNRRLNDALRAGRARKANAEDIDKESVDLLVTCTLSWRGVKWAGSDLEFSADAARMLYTERPWVRQQVEEAVRDRENFLPS